MRKLGAILVVGMGLIALTLPARAADMPVKAPAAPAAVPFTWSGFYIGANYGRGRTTAHWTNLDNTTLFGDNVPPDVFDNDLSGAIYGGQIGYNFQRGPWVFGVEALIDASRMEGDYTSIAGAADDQFNVNIDTLMLFTGRIGYAFDRVLVYGKAGLGVARVSVSVTDTVPLSTGSGSGSAWRTGFTVGAGLEYAITSNLIVGVEYDYLRLDSGDYQLGDATGSYRWNVETRDVRLLMGRVSYRFGGL